MDRHIFTAKAIKRRRRVCTDPDLLRLILGTIISADTLLIRMCQTQFHVHIYIFIVLCTHFRLNFAINSWQHSPWSHTCSAHRVNALLSTRRTVDSFAVTILICLKRRSNTGIS